METQPEPTSSLTFSQFELDSRIKQATQAMGFDHPTEVQAAVIPLANESKDLWVCAKTGSGKTAAFLIPALQHLLQNCPEDNAAKVLILAPTRELAKQTHKQCRQLAEFTPIKSGLIIGGEDFKKQSALFAKSTAIIIATPGRLIEVIEEGSADFSRLDLLILDEADRMLDMGFKNDLLKIASVCKPERQTLLFSATLNPTIKGIALALLKEPKKIYLDGIQAEHEDIEQQMLLADDFEHKKKLLIWLLSHETYEKALVFTNTKIHTDQLRGPLRGQKLRVGSLHGDMDQSERNKTMGFFRDGTIDILVATDVAARGLDIEGVDLVINFDLARNGNDYLHRIGRTGRAGRPGLAIALINSTEWNVLAGIERYLQQRLTRRTIKELEGRYKGPKKLKASGKAASSKNKKAEPKKKESKIKDRHRDRKSIGKRRKPSELKTNG